MIILFGKMRQIKWLIRSSTYFFPNAPFIYPLKTSENRKVNAYRDNALGFRRIFFLSNIH